jgi:hypothetical protein
MLSNICSIRRTISLLFLLSAIAAKAQAGSTITDKSYWPNEARPSAYGAFSPSNDISSALAYSPNPHLRIAPQVNGDGGVPRYHGGPKSQ